MSIYLWIDDLRHPPVDGHDWAWRKTSEQALRLLRMAESLERPSSQFTVISFDHDLGGEDTSRPVMMWLAEHNYWPDELWVHSANPVGVEWLMGTANQYAPASTEIYRYLSESEVDSYEIE